MELSLYISEADSDKICMVGPRVATKEITKKKLLNKLKCYIRKYPLTVKASSKGRI